MRRMLEMLCWVALCSATCCSQSTEDGSVDGDWTIRILNSDPDPNLRPNEVVIGTWRLELYQGVEGQLGGSVEKDGWKLKIDESVSSFKEGEITLSANGIVGSENWSIRLAGNAARSLARTDRNSTILMGSLVWSHSSTKQSPREPMLWVSSRRPNPSLLNKKVDWSLKDVDGKTINSSEIRSKQLLIFSKGFSCVHCNEQLQKLKTLWPRFEQHEVRILVIVADSEQNLIGSLKQQTFPFSFLVDPTESVFQQFGLGSFDRTHGIFVIDETGIV